MNIAPPSLPIRTERLLLRCCEPDDLEALLAYHVLEEVHRHLLTGPWTMQDAPERVERMARQRHVSDQEAGLYLAVELDGTVVGDVMLRACDDTLSRGELGWVLHPSYAGRGLATEAVRALLDVAFGHYRMHRVLARLDPRNTASARLCERLGMRREAHLRQDWWSKGEWTDTAVYGLLAAEHPGVRSPA